jgi:hypothetical protein
MANQAFPLGGFDDGLVQLLRQLVAANSAKARENFDSCGIWLARRRPQSCRRPWSTRSRPIRSRVCGRFKTALAINAVARAVLVQAGPFLFVFVDPFFSQ